MSLDLASLVEKCQSTPFWSEFLEQAQGTSKLRSVEPHPVKRTEKKYKDFSQRGRYAVLWQPEIRVVCCAGNPNFQFLLGSKAKLVLFHGCQDAKVSLDSAGIEVTDIALNHLDELLLAGKTPAIIAFPL